MTTAFDYVIGPAAAFGAFLALIAGLVGIAGAWEVGTEWWWGPVIAAVIVDCIVATVWILRVMAMAATGRHKGRV